MDNILLYLQFNPQIPYGHLLFTTAWLLVTLAILYVVLRTIRTKGFATRRTAIGITALLLSTPVLYANLTIPDAIDFEPSFAKSDLIGQWIDEDSEFQLFANGTASLKMNQEYIIQTELENGPGTWKEESGSTITLTNKPPSTGKALLRVIRHRRELRIIVEDTETSQLWDGELGFHKK